MQKIGLFEKNANVLFGEKSRQNDSMIKFWYKGHFWLQFGIKIGSNGFLSLLRCCLQPPIQRLIPADEDDKYCCLTYITHCRASFNVVVSGWSIQYVIYYQKPTWNMRISLFKWIFVSIYLIMKCSKSSAQ